MMDNQHHNYSRERERERERERATRTLSGMKAEPGKAVLPRVSDSLLIVVIRQAICPINIYRKNLNGFRLNT